VIGIKSDFLRKAGGSAESATDFFQRWVKLSSVLNCGSFDLRASLFKIGFSTGSWTRQAKSSDAIKSIAIITSAGIGNFIQNTSRGAIINVWTR
jgi:hypothetical protein